MMATVQFQAAQFEQEANLWKPRRKLNCPIISRATVRFRMQRPVFQWESMYLTLSVSRNLSAVMCSRQERPVCCLYLWKRIEVNCARASYANK